MKAKGLVLVGVLFTLFGAAALAVDRNFMAERIESAGNSDDVHLCYRYLADVNTQVPETYDDLPMKVMLPAFMLSEFKTASLVGFQLFLVPFALLVLPSWVIRRWLLTGRRGPTAGRRRY